VRPANPVRGEVALVLGARTLMLRPSFEALVAAEAEVGPLFALVERAAAGGLTLAEMAALFWHCLGDGQEDRAGFGEALVAGGLAEATPALRALLEQILAGR
jgi:hypothetical protein